MSRVLIVDDDSQLLVAFQGLLAAEGHHAITARSAEAALACLATEQLELIIMDVCMPGMNGLDALHRIKATHPKLPVIVVTGQGTMETAIEAIKRGAYDYQLKPFEPEEMLRLVNRALECVRIMERQVALNPNSATAQGDALIGQGPGMQAIYKMIGRVAPTEAIVLIRGESGTGKELVARAIFQHSRRNNAPLYVVNCVSIPESLLESELFGYERGAFTGAQARRIGKFEQAHGGTIFLDEIGDIPLGMQTKLLRVLQERSFERLGSNETVHVDVRIVAATNRNLETAISQGAFREDLYHRLNVVTIRMPPLREKREDIPLRVDYFLDRFCRELNQERPYLSHEVRGLFQTHSWPGNVRELEHCIHRLLILTGGNLLQQEDVQRALRGDAGSISPRFDSEEGGVNDLVRRYLDFYAGSEAHRQLLDEVERQLLIESLRRTKGNQTRAAKFLGLARPTFHARLQKHGLQPTDGTDPA